MSKNKPAINSRSFFNVTAKLKEAKNGQQVN